MSGTFSSNCCQAQGGVKGEGDTLCRCEGDTLCPPQDKLSSWEQQDHHADATWCAVLNGPNAGPWSAMAMYRLGV
jgi:hypothetical protein